MVCLILKYGVPNLESFGNGKKVNIIEEFENEKKE